MLKTLRENGYSTSIYVVSAQEQESLLSLYEKYERKIAERGIGDRPKPLLEKLKQTGLSQNKYITKNKIAKQGQFPNLKGTEVISRTKDTLMLVKGRSLFIYDWKRLELKAPELS